jgi:hypothetical protein
VSARALLSHERSCFVGSLAPHLLLLPWSWVRLLLLLVCAALLCIRL